MYNSYLYYYEYQINQIIFNLNNDPFRFYKGRFSLRTTG